MARHSIAVRLAIGLTAGTALLWIGAATIAGTVMQRELNQAFDETLRQSAFRLLPLATHDLRESDERPERRVSVLEDDDEESDDDRGSDSGDDSTAAPRDVLAESDYLTYYVRNRAGAVAVRAEDAPETIVATQVPDGFSEVEGQRLFAITDQRSGFSIVVIERTDHRKNAIAQSLGALSWPLVALIPIIAAGIWFALRLAMRPLERLRRDIATRDGHNLAPLSSDGHPVELAPIADAVASLLARLRSALDAERTFAASSAHELRTPIAGALAQTQQLAIELGDRPGSARLKEIEAALRHLAQLSEKLLQLSRLEAGFAQSETEADLRPALALVVADFRSSLAGARVQLHMAPDTPLAARINVDAFAIAVRNLIQNALVHGAKDGPVDVHVGPGRVVRIVSAGPVVPAATLDQIGEPFVRGETSAQGTGLGLAIVRSIMDQTGGSLKLQSPATGRADGFEAILALG